MHDEGFLSRRIRGGDAREVCGESRRAPFGLAAEEYLAEDDREAQGLFGVVVGRRQARDCEEREEVGCVALAGGIGHAVGNLFESLL